MTEPLLNFDMLPDEFGESAKFIKAEEFLSPNNPRRALGSREDGYAGKLRP